MLAKFLSKTPKQLKEHCALLSSEEKQSLYNEVLNEVKDTSRDSRGGAKEDTVSPVNKKIIKIESKLPSCIVKSKSASNCVAV